MRELHPIDNPKRIAVALQFTVKQFSKIIKGLIPQQMEDKWFIYYEDGWLYFHRSWTGFGIYKAKLEKVNTGYVINEFWAERNEIKYRNTNDEEDIETFSFLIAAGLLHEDVRNIYASENIHTGTDALKAWSSMGNLLFGDKQVDITDKIKSVLFGLAVGDALGVPVEYESRSVLQQNPVRDMRGHGTYNLPAGTWSDDSSMAFCLAEALCGDFSLDTIAQNFVKWYHHNYWTPRGNVFDIGNATHQALDRISKGTRPDMAGGHEVSSNGNGSLMRIAPLLFHLLDKPVHERFETIKQVSSITHAHVRSVIACFYYLEFAKLLLEEKDKFEIYKTLQSEIPEHLKSLAINPAEITLFDRLLKENIHELPASDISGSGYVLHTLEASIWCLLTTDNYKDAVLKAVNLGEDTDTTGAVTGALAGLLYGYSAIPKKWITLLARKDDIEELAERFAGRAPS